MTAPLVQINETVMLGTHTQRAASNPAKIPVGLIFFETDTGAAFIMGASATWQSFGGGSEMVPGPLNISTTSGPINITGWSALNLATAAGQAGPISVLPGSGAVASGSTAGTAGGALTARGGTGGAAAAGTGAGGAGGLTTISGAAGGAGTATGLPGIGGTLVIAGGAAGADGGAGGGAGANGASVTIDGGQHSGAGSDGKVSIGKLFSAGVSLGKASTVVDVAGQFQVGTATPTSSQLAAFSSTTQGVGFPVMTTTQKNAIGTPTEGMVVYDVTLHKLCVRTAAAWETITSA